MLLRSTFPSEADDIPFVFLVRSVFKTTGFPLASFLIIATVLSSLDNARMNALEPFRKDAGDTIRTITKVPSLWWSKKKTSNAAIDEVKKKHPRQKACSLL